MTSPLLNKGKKECGLRECTRGERGGGRGRGGGKLLLSLAHTTGKMQGVAEAVDNFRISPALGTGAGLQQTHSLG